MKVEYSNSLRLQLIHEMRNGEFSQLERLPREIVLAERFNISRNHLREVLAQLESEGFITRRHGIGTIINHHVLQIKNRMDIEIEFLDIIHQSGYEPGVSYIEIEEEKADSFVADKLRILEGTDVIRVYRICTANGKPIIYCEDVIEKSRIKGKYTLEDLKPPIFHFLKNFCGIEAYMDITQLHAVVADEKLATALNVQKGSPLFNMEEVDYDIDGNIIFYSRQYFTDNDIEQTILRKKL